MIRRYIAALVVVAVASVERLAAASPPDSVANSIARIFAVKTVGWLDQPPIPVAALDAGHGSGTIISRDGLVLTAQHVVDGALLVTVFPPGATQPVPATVAYENAQLDFAVLVISGDHPHFTPLPKHSTKPTPLQHFNVAGYPLRAQQATALWFDGKVSGPVTGMTSRWEVGTQFNGGLSGGPVLDDNWSLLGIAVQGGNVQAGVSGVG
jgi:S1-C subfamily serine protease